MKIWTFYVVKNLNSVVLKYKKTCFILVSYLVCHSLNFTCTVTPEFIIIKLSIVTYFYMGFKRKYCHNFCKLYFGDMIYKSNGRRCRGTLAIILSSVCTSKKGTEVVNEVTLCDLLSYLYIYFLHIVVNFHCIYFIVRHSVLLLVIC